MGFKKIKTKKYNGIHEYYKNSDESKNTVSLYAVYRDEYGSPKKVNTKTIDKDVALKFLNDKKDEVTRLKKTMDKEELQLQKKVQRKSFTLDQMAALYFDGRTTKGNTDDRQKYAKRVSPILGKKKAAKITTDDINALQFKIQDLYAPKTTNETINSLRALYNVAISKGWVEKNPVIRKKVDAPNGIKKLEESKESGRVLSDDELNELWEIDEFKMNDRLMLFMKLCYYTGARPDAIMNLQVKHINFATKKIQLKAMKGGKAYSRKLTDELEELLRAWIGKYELSYGNFIFFPIQSYLRADTQEQRDAAKNKHALYTGYRRLIQKILDPVFNVGIPAGEKMHRIVIYSLRRTAGTNVYKKYGIKHAQKFLNHTDIVTTVKYLNIDDDMEDIEDAL